MTQSPSAAASDAAARESASSQNVEKFALQSPSKVCCGATDANRALDPADNRVIVATQLEQGRDCPVPKAVLNSLQRRFDARRMRQVANEDPCRMDFHSVRVRWKLLGINNCKFSSVVML
jgi:hypothetical protein